MNTPPIKPSDPEDLPVQDHFLEAINHVDKALSNNEMALGAAKGIIYSIVETLGTMMGDPDLPSHLYSGYEGTLELARELQAKINQLG
jgi:hypothetical protein